MKSDPGVKIKKVFDIGVREDGRVAISGPLQDKMFALSVLNDAMKAVLEYEPPEPSRIIKPHTGGKL